MTVQMIPPSCACALPACVSLLVLLIGSASTATAQGTPPDKPVAAPPLHAGFARTGVTPAVGVEMPGGFEKNFAKGIHDPLWVEAAYLGNGSTELAVAGVDLIMIPRDVVEAARRQAETRCGMPAHNILIAASHTHNGGPVVECFNVESDPAYCRLVAERIAEAVVRARENAVEARIGAGAGREDSVGFNRRFKMKDGTVKTHPGKMNPDIIEPAGPIDPEVAVIAVEDTHGKLLGCLVNFALHGTTLGGDLISADWPCYLRQAIRGGMGSDIGVVFLNGACGDVTQVDNRSPRPAEFGEAWARRVGVTVGAEALKVMAKMEFSPNAPLGVAAESLALPIRDLAASDEELVAREAPASGLGSSGRDVYLREAHLVREMKAKSPTVDAEIQAIRIGDAGIVGNPAEFFCELGLAIKRGSPYRLTLVAELANGYAGYAPTAEAFKGGGYETRTARSSFLAPGAGERIVEASAQLLRRLAAK
jgi:hypothetical protein